MKTTQIRNQNYASTSGRGWTTDGSTGFKAEKWLLNRIHVRKVNRYLLFLNSLLYIPH